MRWRRSVRSANLELLLQVPGLARSARLAEKARKLTNVPEGLRMARPQCRLVDWERVAQQQHTFLRFHHQGPHVQNEGHRGAVFAIDNLSFLQRPAEQSRRAGPFSGS